MITTHKGVTYLFMKQTDSNRDCAGCAFSRPKPTDHGTYIGHCPGYGDYSSIGHSYYNDIWGEQNYSRLCNAHCKAFFLDTPENRARYTAERMAGK